MRRALVLGPLVVVSIAFFVAAAFAPSSNDAILLATCGALAPALGLIVLSLVNMLRWRRMGHALGLVPKEGGMFPDMEGRRQGRRLYISRRHNPYGMGSRISTLVKLEGTPDVLLPGLVVDAGVVRGILEPLEGRDDRRRAD